MFLLSDRHTTCATCLHTLTAQQVASARLPDNNLPVLCWPLPLILCCCRMWGDVVKWGSNFHTNTPGECCEACQKHVPPTGGPTCNGESRPIMMQQVSQ